MKREDVLGRRLVDTVTGFSGTATSFTVYDNGCVQFFIEPAVDEKGTKPEGVWMDEQRLSELNSGSSIKDLLEEGELATAGGGIRPHPGV